MAGKQADIKVGVITNYDPKGLKQAETGLKGFQSSIKQADGFTGKFKAGASSAMEGIGGAVKGLAIAGAASFVAFGQDIVNAGVKMASMDAKAKTVFGDSLAAVQAWADANAAAMGLTGRAAVGAAANIQDLLIPMGFAREEATDMSLKLLDLGGALSAWSGGTKSAAEVSQIFAKAMLGERDELKSLGIAISEADVSARLAVKGQQNLTGAALAQAKAMATQELIYEKSTDAQAAWSDGSMDATKRANEAKAGFADMSEMLTESLYPAIANLIPTITKLVEILAKVPETLGELSDSTFEETGDSLAKLAEQYGLTSKQQADFYEQLYTGAKTLEDVTKEIVAMSGSLREQEKSWETQTGLLDKVAEASAETDRETRRLKGSFEAIKSPIDTAARAMDTFRSNVSEADLAFRGLTSKLDEEEAWENVNTKIEEFNKESKKSPELIRDTTRAIGDYVIATDTIPAEKKTEILVALKAGDIAKAELLLANLERTRTIYLDLIARGSGDIIAKLGAVGAKASGGPVSKGSNYLVGEQGPELVHMNGNGNVSNARDTAKMLGGGGGNTYNVTLAMPVIASQADFYRAGQTITAAIAEFERRRGF